MVNFLFLLFLFICNQIFSKDKIEINADQFTYDKDNTRIYATGNVEIIDEEFKLYAKKVFVNNSTKVLSARENVKIFNSDGSVLKADKIVADHSLRNAIIENNYLYIPSNNEGRKDYYRLAAKKVERRDETWEKMEYGTFTTCKLCYNEKKKKFDEPLIQLKAKKIIHDKETLDVKYYDAFLDFKGQSIFYLPYFSHPSPLVKRKKGFLAPNISQTYYFGMGVNTPYYYPISEYEDLTIIPKLSQKKNPALFFEHRKNYKNGEIFNKFSGTVENQKNNQIKEDRKRGHIHSKGIFDLNSQNSLNYQIHRTTDRNYLNTYKYGYTDVLESSLKLDSIKANNLFSFQSYLFQDLRRQFNQKEIPKILPRLFFNLNSDKSINSLNYSTNIEFANLIRSSGNETKKLFLTQSIFFPTISNDGTLIKLGSYLNAGAYNIEKYENPRTGNFEYNKFRANFFPQLSLEISKPYYMQKGEHTSIISPKILAVKNFKNSFNRAIPDESNINNFDFDFIDLFNINRLHGNDRFDPISRVDYGLSFLKKTTVEDKEVSSIDIGQSYQLKENKFLGKNTGIRDRFSDIVSNIKFVPMDNLHFNSFFAVEKDNFALKTAYSNLLIRQKNSYLSISNTHAQPVVDENGENIIDGKSQFSINFKQNFYDYWNFTAYTTFDKKSKLKLYNYGSKIKYEDECFGVSVSWTRQFTHNPEDPTSNNFVFLFSLKEIMESDL